MRTFFSSTRNPSPTRRLAPLRTPAKLALGTAVGLGALWFIGLPVLSTGLVLAGATGMAIVATKYNDRFPLQGPYRHFGQASRFISRKLAPFVYCAAGGYLGYLAYESNANLKNVFDSVDLDGTFGATAVLLLIVNRFVRTNTKKLEDSYGGHLDPGEKKYLKKLVSGASYSIPAEAHYIATRAVLMAACLSFIVINTAAALGLPGLLPILIPLLTTLLTVRLRAREDVVYKSVRQAKTSDHFKIYTPAWGMAGGAALSLFVAATSGSWIAPIAYATFFGSLSAFASDSFGAFHSINTSFGLLASARASSKDLVGEEVETRKLTKDVSVLAVNPHTGINEHTFGVLFSSLINTKPGLTILPMFDRPLFEMKNGQLIWMRHQQDDQEFIGWVKELQTRVYQTLILGIDPTLPLERQYDRLSANLEILADYFATDLQAEIWQTMEQRGSAWFDPTIDINEYLRDGFEQLDLRAESFRTQANKLRRQVLAGYIDQPNFDRNLAEVAGCYDPDRVKIIPVCRKSIAGDEREVRKVENVSSAAIFRAVTVYKGWFKESGDRLPAEDWICGTWTQVPNPCYDYKAQLGTMEASKFLWIPLDPALTEFQRNNQDYLSTSRWIAEVDNQPTEAEGFAAGAITQNIEINGETIVIDDYYYVTCHDQSRNPVIKDFTLRPGLTENDLPDNFPYQLTTYCASGACANLGPEVFTIPATDFILMMDKNDIQIGTYRVLPAILQRARQDTLIHLIFRRALPDEYMFDDPHPNLEVDYSYGLQAVDGNLELSYGPSFIPFKLDRGAAHLGRDEAVNWKTITGAQVTMSAGQAVAFSLIYGERNKAAGTFAVPLPSRDFPEHLSLLSLPNNGQVALIANPFTSLPNRDGDASWVKIHYIDPDNPDGPRIIGFSRVADGKRPKLCNKDLFIGRRRPR